MVAETTSEAEQVLRDMFSDDPLDRFLSYRSFDLEGVQVKVRQDGFAVVHALIPVEHIEQIRSYWLARWAEVASSRERRSSISKWRRDIDRVTWNAYLGQANTVGFSRDSFQCLYRSCDFLWNEPMHDLTRQICVRLNSLRNLILGLPPLRGLLFDCDRYGIFVTTSYYPPGEGWMEMHNDGVGGGIPLLHHIAPLTFKGRDYDGGGMALRDRSGRRVDVDAQLRPGSAVFYDGALSHGVDRIVPGRSDALGRLQMFAIPTRFVNAEVNRTYAENLPLRLFLQSRWLRLKNEARDRLGFSRLLR